MRAVRFRFPCRPGLGLAALCLGGAAWATPPQRLPGLWQLTLDGRPAAARQCVGPRDDVMKQRDFDAVRVRCEPAVWRQDGSGRWVSDQRCAAPGLTTAHHAVFAGDFARRLDVDLLSTTTPEQGTATERRQVLRMERLGDCPAGVSPGALVLPNGQVLDPARALPGRSPRHP